MPIAFIGLLLFIMGILAYAGLRYETRSCRRYGPSVGFPPRPQLMELQVTESSVLSCFVKGVIRSIIEHPDEWPMDPPKTTDFYTNSSSSAGGWTHASGVTVILSIYTRCLHLGGPRDYTKTETRSVYLMGGDHSLTSHESTALLSAIDQYLEGPRLRAIERQIAHDRAIAESKAALIRAPFERLGCPQDGDLA